MDSVAWRGALLMRTFKRSQRVKRGTLRGTVLGVLTHEGYVQRKEYVVRMDNGALVKGTAYQFQPVRVVR